MHIDDICDTDFWKRVTHYQNQFVKDGPMQDRIILRKQAINCATGEMLDEIHTMLRTLTKNKGKQSD